MSVERIKAFLTSREFGNNDVITATKGEILAAIRDVSINIFESSAKFLLGNPQSVSKVESEATEYKLKPIFVDGSKLASRNFNDRYMTVENVEKALESFSEDEVPLADVAERIATNVISVEQRRFRAKGVNLSKVTKSRMNSVIAEINSENITSELAKKLKDRIIQKHKRWLLKK